MDRALFSVLLIFSIISFVQGAWERTYGGGITDVCYAMAQTQDGGFIMAGMSNSWSGSWPDAYLVKTDVSGNLVWQQTYGGSMGDYLYSIKETAASGYVCAGIFNAPFACDVYLLRVNSQGNSVWMQTFGGSGDDRGYDVMQTLDGGYTLIGYTTSFGAGGDDAYLIHTDTSGNMVWQVAIGANLSDRAYAIIQTQAHDYIFCGASNSQSGGLARDAWLVKTDSMGTKIWEHFYGGSGDESANALAQTSDGGYILCGATSSSGAGSYDIYVIKTDAGGNLVWEKTYGGTNEDMGFAISQSQDGGYFIVGHTASFGSGGFDVYIIKTDGQGNVQWSSTYGGSDWDYGRSGFQTPDLGYIIAGYTMSYGAGDYDFYLIKRDPGGIEDGAPGTFIKDKRLNAFPNPFVSFTRIPGYEHFHFLVYDLTGKRVGRYKGDRIGEDLPGGVYYARCETQSTVVLRIVKVE